jgi:hypothetical protein
MEQVVDLIHDSFTGDATDDKVLVQIFKARTIDITKVCLNGPQFYIHRHFKLQSVVRRKDRLFIRQRYLKWSGQFTISF